MAKKSEKSRKSGKVKPGQGGGGGGYWGGRPLWDNSAYLPQYRHDITQTFMVDSPGDNIQTHKFLGRNSPRDRVGGQKSLENPENPERGPGTSASEDWGRARLYNQRTTEPENHRAIKGKALKIMKSTTSLVLLQSLD